MQVGVDMGLILRYVTISSDERYRNALYGFIVTLCGADSRHGIETQWSKIASPDFQLGPREVTMNHIIKHEAGTGEDPTYILTHGTRDPEALCQSLFTALLPQ